MTISEFLLARLADDIAALAEYLDPGVTARALGDGMVALVDADGREQVMGESSLLDGYLHDQAGRRAALEVDAKRQIIALAQAVEVEPNPPTTLALADDVLIALASVYADHPDHDPTWR